MCDTCSDDLKEVIDDRQGLRKMLNEAVEINPHDDDWIAYYHGSLNNLVSQSFETSSPHMMGSKYRSKYERLIESFKAARHEQKMVAAGDQVIAQEESESEGPVSADEDDGSLIRFSDTVVRVEENPKDIRYVIKYDQTE